MHGISLTSPLVLGLYVAGIVCAVLVARRRRRNSRATKVLVLVLAVLVPVLGSLVALGVLAAGSLDRGNGPPGQA